MDEFAGTKEIMELTAFIMVMKDGYLRDKVIALLREETERTGKILLARAISDGHISEREIQDLMYKYGARRDEIAEIFKVFYDKGIEIDDGEKGVQKHIMVTIEGSGIWNMRDYIKKKFGLVVLNQDEAIDFMRELKFKEEHK